MKIHKKLQRNIIFPHALSRMVCIVWPLLLKKQAVFAFVLMPNQLHQLLSVPEPKSSMLLTAPNDRNEDKDHKHTKQEWVDRSLKYYMTLRRIRNNGANANNINMYPNPFIRDDEVREAVLMHAALQKIKEQKYYHAEVLCKYPNKTHGLYLSYFGIIVHF
jgi:hypothetical protein